MSRLRQTLATAQLRHLLSGLIILIVTTATAEDPPALRTDSLSPIPSFEKDILPILARKCHACHGKDIQEANLDLRTVSAMLRGGESGPAVVAGDSEGSMLIDLIARDQMPPTGEEKLTAGEVSTLRRWVAANLPADEKRTVLPPKSQLTETDRSFWAFQTPRKAALPPIQSRDRVRTPIDTFLLTKLESARLSFSPEADRTALIRRAYFDLIGLPPEPAEVQAFLKDSRPDAYERLVDELLASPHYGERWGRHWLDAAGYVDGKLDNDLTSVYPNEGIWRYRDYVIQAFNDDKPYDRFLIEQLAGDELVDWRTAESFSPETITLLTATGFLRNVDDHTDFPQYGIEKRYEVVNEVLDMFSTALLGLTVECCRCHNHKYDPLTQRDYYRLMACFEPALNVHDWKIPKERFLADVPLSQRAAIDKHNAEHDMQVAELQKVENATRQKVNNRLVDLRLMALPDPIRMDVKQALETATEKRNVIQKYLAERFQATFRVDSKEIDNALTELERAELASNQQNRRQLTAQRKTYGVIQALWDVGAPPASRIHRRGDVKALGQLVQPGFPEILQQPADSLVTDSKVVAKGSSGRRLALAHWLTRPSHPLAARVFVNRVWHHHFGRGIVETLGNFGRSGSLPTHPELLDWLTTDFVENGWSIKHLHKRLMLSTAYRQSSRRPTSNAVDLNQSLNRAGVDPANRLLWRMNLRRLEAEIGRDAVLAASGSLDRQLGGPPIEMTAPADGLSEVKPATAATSPFRRSIYIFARRVYPLKFLEIFDAPIMPVNCTQRTNSVTVLQSLAQLNSEFLFEQSDRMAARVKLSGGTDWPPAIALAFQLALSRKPTDGELRNSQAFITEQTQNHRSPGISTEKAAQMALADLCHMLLSSNEFLYVE